MGPHYTADFTAVHTATTLQSSASAFLYSELQAYPKTALAFVRAPLKGQGYYRALYKGEADYDPA